MANSLKRMLYAEEAGFQKRVAYYFWLRASQVMALAEPDATELAFAKAVYSDRVSKKDMCLVVITNTTVGTTIDGGSDPTENDLEWSVITDNQFGNLAQSYNAAGLI